MKVNGSCVKNHEKINESYVKVNGSCANNHIHSFVHKFLCTISYLFSCIEYRNEINNILCIKMKTLIQTFLCNKNKMFDSEIRTWISFSVFLTQVFRFFKFIYFFFANADIEMGNTQSLTITDEKVSTIYTHLLKPIASAY